MKNYRVIPVGVIMSCDFFNGNTRCRNKATVGEWDEDYKCMRTYCEKHDRFLVEFEKKKHTDLNLGPCKKCGNVEGHVLEKELMEILEE